MKVQLNATRHMPAGIYDLVCMGRHKSGQPHIVIFDGDDGTTWMRVTIDLPETSPRSGCIFVKDYSENEGIVRSLVEAGIIGEPCDEHDINFVTVYECPLTARGVEIVDGVAA